MPSVFTSAVLTTAVLAGGFLVGSPPSIDGLGNGPLAMSDSARPRRPLTGDYGTALKQLDEVIRTHPDGPSEHTNGARSSRPIKDDPRLRWPITIRWRSQEEVATASIFFTASPLGS